MWHNVKGDVREVVKKYKKYKKRKARRKAKQAPPKPGTTEHQVLYKDTGVNTGKYKGQPNVAKKDWARYSKMTPDQQDAYKKRRRAKIDAEEKRTQEGGGELQ